jgi:phosphate transport system permease protein
MTQSSRRIAQKGRAETNFKTSTSARHALDWAFAVLVFVATIIGLVVLAILLVDIAVDGVPRLSWEFITSFPSSFPENAGVYPALLGSLFLLLLIAVLSVPLGVGAAVYLQEYAPDNWLTRTIEVNISNLAGVPSIIYGLLGLALFVNWLAPITGGKSVLSGALTLILLILPVIIIATREALRAIPDTVREAGFALGATRWEVMRHVVLRRSLPGVTGATMLGLGRALGETIAVAFLIGASQRWAPNLFFGGDAMTSVIVNTFQDARPEAIWALMGIGVLLFTLTMAVNVAARVLVWRVGRVTGDAAL